MKTCAMCKNEQNVENFSFNNKVKQTRVSYCKPCAATYDRNRKRTHPRNRTKEEFRASNLKWKYGINEDQYIALLEKQDNRCMGCRKHYSEFTKRFAIDHDHACCPGQKICGKCFRGLLCTGCNLILGYAKDDPKILNNLISYLENFDVYNDYGKI